MSKITAQNIKDIGFIAEMFRMKADDAEVIGTDGKNYRCIVDHIAADASKPITGADWEDYWVLGGINGAVWVTATNYKALFKAFLDGVIASQAAILEGRVGSTIYASSTSPAKERVARAELCLTAAELIQIRINVMLSKEMRTGHDIDILKEGTQKKVYLSEAEELIAVLVAERTTDSAVSFASGTVVTTHF